MLHSFPGGVGVFGCPYLGGLGLPVGFVPLLVLSNPLGGVGVMADLSLAVLWQHAGVYLESHVSWYAELDQG